MEFRRIGSLEVSVVGLGCNNFGMRIDEASSAAVVEACLDNGINFFDTADIYGGSLSEQYLGRALGDRRSEVVIATKFGMELDAQHRGARPEYVHVACEDSLRRLGTDYIDLYWLHQPDPEVPVAETLGAMTALKASGKVRELGCSNFTVGQLREARTAADSHGHQHFVALQNEYSLLHREPEGEASGEEPSWPPYPNDGSAKRGTLEECRRQRMAFIPYFPLASGLLSGKYHAGETPPEGTRLANTKSNRFMNDDNLALVERLRAFAEARGDEQGSPRTLLQLAFGYLLAQQPVASVIAGATRPEQVRSNTQAAGWRLSAEELADLQSILNA
jgi:aryl-alcohol dehydrogenase-like predicted oxidoreductase